MDVILSKRVEKLGKPGEVIKVKDGYARNFLFPQKFAIPATKENLAWNQAQAARRQAEEEKERTEFQELARKMEETALEVKAKAGEEKKLFGSVTSQEIAKVLKEAGFPVDKKQIQLEEPIKMLGDYEVPVKLHHDVTAKIKISVVPK